MLTISMLNMATMRMIVTKPLQGLFFPAIFSFSAPTLLVSESSTPYLLKKNHHLSKCFVETLFLTNSPLQVLVAMACWLTVLAAYWALGRRSRIEVSFPQISNVTILPSCPFIYQFHFWQSNLFLFYPFLSLILRFHFPEPSSFFQVSSITNWQPIFSFL